MLPVNYHHLYYFWMTAKTGSITQACGKLLLAQPTLSLQIGQLEKFVGKKLLYRSRQGVSLTPEGRIAFEYCERIFSNGDSMLAAIRQGETTRHPVLRLGADKSISREIVLKMFDEIRALDARIHPTIFSGTTQELQERLERYQLDLVLSERDFSSLMGKGYVSKLVGALPIYFVAAPELKRGLDRFPPRGQALTALLRAPDNPIRKDVERYLSRHQTRLSVAAETEDSDLIRILAIRGRGIAALNTLVIQEDLKAGRLVRLHPRPTGIQEYIWLISRSDPTTAHPSLRPVLQGLLSRFKIVPRAHPETYDSPGNPDSETRSRRDERA